MNPTKKKFRDLFRWHCRDVLRNPTKHWKGKRFWIGTFDVRGRVAGFECRFVVGVVLLVVVFVAMRWIRMVNYLHHWRRIRNRNRTRTIQRWQERVGVLGEEDGVDLSVSASMTFVPKAAEGGAEGSAVG